MTKYQRTNVTITGESIAEIMQLRDLLEKRLLMRLSIAQVIKRMTKENLAIELAELSRTA